MAAQVCQVCGHSAGKMAKFCGKCSGPLVSKTPPPSEPAVETLTEIFLDGLENDTPRDDGLADPSGPEAHAPLSGEGFTEEYLAEILPVKTEPPFALEVVNGLKAGVKIPMAPDRPVVVGADNMADLALPEDPYMSRRHASFSIEGGKLIVEDEESTNGTFIRVRGRRQVTEGDTVIVGKTVLRVVSEG